MAKSKQQKARPERHLPRNAPRKSGKRGPRPQDREDAQGKLLDVPAPPPATIQNGRASMHFVKYVPDRDKNRNRIVTLNLTLELEDAHKGLFPREVEDAWKDLKRGSVKRIDPDGIGPQKLDIAMVPGAESDLVVTAAVKRASISRIKTKGKGKTRSVIRLSFGFVCSFDAQTERFCHNNYDETLWVKLEGSQLVFEEGEEEDHDDA